MAHKCKCYWCGQEFDRDKVQAVRASTRRYGHLECVPEGEEDKYELVPLPPPKEKKKKKKENVDEELIKLEEYIIQLFKVEYVPPRIKKQIKQFHEEYNYTYSGIRKSLIYFFEIQGNSVEKYGATIGIVPWVHDQAKQYFYMLFLAKKANENLKKEQIQMKIVEYQIPQPIQKKKKIRLFTFEEEE